MEWPSKVLFVRKKGVGEALVIFLRVNFSFRGEGPSQTQKVPQMQVYTESHNNFLLVTERDSVHISVDRSIVPFTDRFSHPPTPLT